MPKKTLLQRGEDVLKRLDYRAYASDRAEHWRARIRDGEWSDQDFIDALDDGFVLRSDGDVDPLPFRIGSARMLHSLTGWDPQDSSKRIRVVINEGRMTIIDLQTDSYIAQDFAVEELSDLTHASSPTFFDLHAHPDDVIPEIAVKFEGWQRRFVKDGKVAARPRGKYGADERSFQVLRAAVKWKIEHGQEPTDTDLAALLDLPARTVGDARRRAKRWANDGAPLSRDEELDLLIKDQAKEDERNSSLDTFQYQEEQAYSQDGPRTPFGEPAEDE